MWDARLFGLEFYNIFYIFILYSVFGWVYESCLVSIKKKALINRGFLTGPIIPIYGCGALLAYISFWDIRDKIIVVFICGALLATILEYITSLIMESIFHTRWWDYSEFWLNLKGRVCLPVSLLWGALTLLMLHIFQQGIDFLIGRMDREIGETIGYIIIPVFIIDITIAVVSSVKFDKLLSKLHDLRLDMTEYIVSTSLYETGEELVEKVSNIRMPEFFSDFKLVKPEIETKMKEFLKRYQNITTKKAYVRLLKAFPSMKVGKREDALRDMREKITMKGVKALGKDLREEVTGTIKGYLSGFFRAAVVGLLVIAQFALIIYLSFALREYTIYIYSFLQIFSIIIIIGLVNDNRNASYKISWICIIAAFPITGHIMFMLWGNMRRNKLDQKILIKLMRGKNFLEYDPEVMKRFSEKYPTKSRMTKYLESYSFPLYKNNKLTYYPMGEDTFDAIFEEIDKAEKFILMNFFIVGEGVLWDRLHEKLLNKLKQGIRVMFLYDDFGAMLRTPRNFKKKLEKEGFEVRVFNPIQRYTDQLYMNYRSHQKIIVIDGNVGFTGGMNLADEYVNLVHRFGIWKDNAIKVEGDAVWGLTVTFLSMWEVSGEGERMDYNPFKPTKKFEQNDIFCQVVSDGPADNPKNPMENIYKQTIYYAKKVLYITTPYLIIEDDMREALITTAASGIDVRIITPFIPDKKNVKILTNYNYGRLLEAGVRIFEYTPGFIHAKTIINEDCGIVGTVNMDFRSFHLHYECGIWMCDRKTIDIIREDLIKTMEQCHEVTYEKWKNRPFYIKFYQRILNLFATLM